jgi:lysozyme
MIRDAFQLAREALVKPFEGYHRRLPDGRCRSYPDPGTGGAPWTIGWGTTGPHVTPETVWDESTATAELDREVAQKAMGLFKLSPNLAGASDRRIAALISFAYNCGLGNYRISTLRKRVEAGDWAGAAEEIVKWNKAAGRVLPGLTRRRVAEASFLN